MMNDQTSNLIEKANREITQQNCRISEKIDDIMQTVMGDEKIQNRSDWEQIQKTLTLIIESMESAELASELTPSHRVRRSQVADRSTLDFAE